MFSACDTENMSQDDAEQYVNMINTETRTPPKRCTKDVFTVCLKITQCVFIITNIIQT